MLRSACSVILLGERPVEQRRAGGPDVEHAVGDGANLTRTDLCTSGDLVTPGMIIDVS